MIQVIVIMEKKLIKLLFLNMILIVKKPKKAVMLLLIVKKIIRLVNKENKKPQPKVYFKTKNFCQFVIIVIMMKFVSIYFDTNMIL